MGCIGQRNQFSIRLPDSLTHRLSDDFQSLGPFCSGFLAQVGSLMLVHQVRGWFSGAVAELAILEGASEAPVCESYRSSEQRAKIANSARPKGLS